MKNNGYAGLLLEEMGPDADQDATKTASEAAAGEIFGRMTKEAQEEIVGTAGWAGAELSAKVAQGLAPTLDKVAKVVGLLIPLVDRLEKISAEISNNAVPLDQHDMPKVTPGEGIGDSVSESANQDTATGIVEITDDTQGFPGKPQIHNMIDQFLKADVLTNTTAMGTGNNPPGERPEDFDPGKVRTASENVNRLQTHLASLVEKGASATEIAKVAGMLDKAKGALKNFGGRIADQFKKQTVSGSGMGFKANLRTKVDAAASKAGRGIKNNATPFAAGLAAGGAAGVAAGSGGRKKESSDLEASGAAFRKAINGFVAQLHGEE